MNDGALVIGVGNRMRRDDGAGPAVLDILAARGIEITEVAGDCARLIELWDGRGAVHVVDAMRSGQMAGTVARLDALGETIPRDNFLNTSHVFGVAEAVETGRLLGRLPQGLIVWGIEGIAFDNGASLTPAVAVAVAEVANQLAQELAGAPAEPAHA